MRANSNTHPRNPEIDLDFFRLSMKSSKFSLKIIYSCIDGSHMVTSDVFKAIATDYGIKQKTSKNSLKCGSKKSIFPKIPEIDSEILELATPDTILL